MLKRFAVRAASAFALAGALTVAMSSTLHAQAGATVDPSVGVLVIAHGADAAWNAPVDSLAAAVRQGGVVRGPVAVSFLMGSGASTHRFQDAVAELRRGGAQRVVVVPLLVSSNSGHYDQIRYLAGALDSIDEQMMHHLHMSGLERATGVPMVVTPALDDAAELGEVLATRATSLAPHPADRALFLFGHGPNSAEDYAAWMTRLRAVAAVVQKEAGFASVAVELVRDDAPAEVRGEAVKRAREIIGLQHAATKQDVIVVPVLVSSGDVSKRKLPADLAGLSIVYAGAPILPDARIARWVERRVADAVATKVSTEKASPRQ